MPLPTVQELYAFKYTDGTGRGLRASTSKDTLPAPCLVSGVESYYVQDMLLPLELEALSQAGVSAIAIIREGRLVEALSLTRVLATAVVHDPSMLRNILIGSQATRVVGLRSRTGRGIRLISQVERENT